MNKVIMCGRLTKDPEVRWTAGENQKSVAKWSIAVDRQYKKDGKTEADFFNCVTFGKTAELLEKYWHKGMKMLLEGRLQNDHYKDREGKMQYAEQIVVDAVEFVEKKEDSKEPAQATFTDLADEGIPFSF